MSDSDGFLDFPRRALEQLALLVQRVADGLSSSESEPESEDEAERAPEWLDTWKSGASQWMPRPFGPTDTVSVVGRPLELKCELSTLDRILNREFNVFVDEELVGTGHLDAHGLVRVVVTPQSPGVHRVFYQRAKSDARSDRVFSHLLQVVAEARPVIAVDIEIVRSEGIVPLAPLVSLGQQGFDLFYFDLHAVEPLPTWRQLLSSRRAPMAAILADVGEPQLQTLGVDFDSVLLGAALRRLRASGAGVCGIVTDRLDLAESTGLPEWGAGLEARGKSFDEFLEECKSAFGAYSDIKRASRSDTEFRLDVMTDTASVEGNQCSVELDNRAAREALFGAIDEASSHVLLQFYILEEGSFVEELSLRLVQRARAGVQIRLVVDAVYSLEGVLGSVNPIVEGLKAEPNIEVEAADPIPRFKDMHARSMKERDHRKVVIIDDELAFVSGRNAGDAYYYGFDEVPIMDFTSHERIPWLDAHVELRGPLVARVRDSFEDAWMRSGGGSLPLGNKEPRPLTGDGGRCRLVVHNGIRDTNALGAYEAIIAAAKKRIFVVNAYPVFSRLHSAIHEAVLRGIEVRMLTGNAKARRDDGTFFRGPLHRELFDYMLKQRLEGLVRDGVHLYEYTTERRPNIVARGGAVRPYVHAKILVADGEVASIGSANLDATASYWEREANIIIEGGDVPAALEARLTEMCQRSYRVDLDSDYWRREKAQREIAARLWPTSLYS